MVSGRHNHPTRISSAKFNKTTIRCNLMVVLLKDIRYYRIIIDYKNNPPLLSLCARGPF
jgi:hypothetical protein